VDNGPFVGVKEEVRASGNRYEVHESYENGLAILDLKYSAGYREVHRQELRIPPPLGLARSLDPEPDNCVVRGARGCRTYAFRKNLCGF
jgi:hypothetical protein